MPPGPQNTRTFHFKVFVHLPTRRQTRKTAAYTIVVTTLKTVEPTVDDALHRECTDFSGSLGETSKLYPPERCH